MSSATMAAPCGWCERPNVARQCPDCGTFNRDYNCYGNLRKVWTDRSPNLLVEGPAGTGKTRCIVEHDVDLCEREPGVRILWVRQTRESMTESVLWTLEDEVLWPDHPMMLTSAEHRRRRSEYRHPNGSVILVRGLDKPGRTYSQQYDLIRVFEAWETTLDAWERLGRCMRNAKLGWRQMLADTNPAAEYHWLNQMALETESGALEHDHGIVRLRTRHRDNPVYWDHGAKEWTKLGAEYVEGRLKSLTGARRANLYEGRWAAAEGIILEEYDPGTHIIEAGSDRHKQVMARGFDWYFGSIDWGMRHPGALTIWGVQDSRMYGLVEVYQTGWIQEDWVELIMEQHAKYPLEALVCDPSEPQWIKTLNKRFGPARGRDGERIARKGKNDIGAGIDMLRWMLKDHRIFWMGDRMVLGRDRERVAQRKPCSTTEEIPSWVYCEAEDGKPMKEKPDPRCADHGIDETRYAVMFLNIDLDLTPPQPKPKFAPTSYGAMYDFEWPGGDN